MVSFEFLAWLNTPGKGVTIIPQQGNFEKETALVSSAHLDCVDAIICHLADTITDQCKLGRSLLVATFDTRIFTGYVAVICILKSMI